MLARVVASSSPSQFMATRAFSTSLPLRLTPSYPSFDSNSSRSKVRSNPLVGSYVPAEPAQPESSRTPPVSTGQPSPESSAEVTPSADLSPPPPPPPPTIAADSTSTNTTEAAVSQADKPQHAYTAASSLSSLNIDIANIISDKATKFGSALNVDDPLKRPKVRAKAVAGRTVFIKDRLTPTSAPTPMVAIRVLERMCREQKIKNKFHSQKFHERKGLKKKRLRSQRWRSRFKTGFKAAVNRVLELKKQGW